MAGPSQQENSQKGQHQHGSGDQPIDHQPVDHQPVDRRGPWALRGPQGRGTGTGPRERACPGLGSGSEHQSDWTGFRRGSVPREALKGQMGN